LIGLKKSSLLVKMEEEHRPAAGKRIDVWWRGRDRNGELMLILAHIMARSMYWEQVDIRILRLLDSEEAVNGVIQDLMDLVQSSRVEAEPTAVMKSDKDEPFISALNRISAGSDLVLLGVAAPQAESIPEQAEYLAKIMELPLSIMLVRSGEVDDVLL
jgi:hypothetical protein